MENEIKAKAKDIKAIFFDIDGTLVPINGKQIPISARKSIEALRAKGIKTIIATGRHSSEIKGLPVMDTKFDGYLTLNGSLILDETMQAYAGTPIPKGDMEVLSQMFLVSKIPFIMIGEKKRYINFVNSTVVDVQSSTNGTIPDIDNYEGEDIYQIVAFIPPHQREILKSILDECSITSWNEMGIDIIPKGAGKQVGITAYLEANGLTPDNIMAFGDGENDIEMLKLAGIGVAMGNASDKVKAAADYVTDGVDVDGVEHALKHFGLI